MAMTALRTLALSVALLLLQAQLATASFVKYRPLCNYTKEFVEPKTYKRWSDKKTWSTGIIPGIGKNRLASVEIPCKVGIILDISVTLDRLIINGFLKVVDKKKIVVNAHFVIVQGKVTIGTAKKPYPGKIIFNLTRASYTYGWIRPDGEDNAGIKVFAVLGGLVEFNGMYGNQAAWTTLTQTAKKGTTSITLKGDVSAWPVGGKIAIASTDYDYRQSETRIIKKVTKVSSNTRLTLDRPLTYMHWGSSISTGVSGVSISEAAEVALLTRSIVIQGAPESNSKIGGHFVIFQTGSPQLIQGIELFNMGQRGIHGRYPLYWFLSQSAQNSYVKKVSIHQSKQRCLVLHGTWNLLMEQNVAYDNYGHCFFMEDGMEFGNVFRNNLAFLTRQGTAKLPGGTNSTQNDDFPASFWISNPNNTLVGNVAAGSQDSGFWFHFSSLVYGASRQYPQSLNVYPKHVALKEFRDNVAHSNGRSGLRTWPEGYRPRAYDRRSKKSPLKYAPVTAVLKNFRAYKNGYQGMFISKSDNIQVSGGVFADNRLAAVELRDAEKVTVRGAVILGETANVGNPSGCNSNSNKFANCEPLSGSCSLPVSVSKARSLGLGRVARNLPLVGIMITQGEYPSDGYTTKFAQGYYPLPNLISNVKFRGFNSRCKVEAAISANGDRRERFMPTHAVEKLTFLDNSPRVYMAPRLKGVTRGATFDDAGSVAYSYAFKDKDGSLVGSPGYVVSNTPALLPASSKACKAVKGGNYGYLCPKTCYRQMVFLSGDRTRPKYAVGRSGTSSKFTVDEGRTAFINFLADGIHTMLVNPAPEYLSYSFSDPQGCQGSVRIRFQAPSGFHWQVALISDSKKCAGSSTEASCKIQRNVICSSSGSSSLEIFFGGKSYANVILYRARGKDKSC